MIAAVTRPSASIGGLDRFPPTSVGGLYSWRSRCAPAASSLPWHPRRSGRLFDICLNRTFATFRLRETRRFLRISLRAFVFEAGWPGRHLTKGHRRITTTSLSPSRPPVGGGEPRISPRFLARFSEFYSPVTTPELGTPAGGGCGAYEACLEAGNQAGRTRQFRPGQHRR